jgi:hypothetical protein
MPRELPVLDTSIAQLPPVTSRYLSRLPAIIQSTGSTGSGKTYSVLQLICAMRKEGSIDKVYLCSPSASSNSLYKTVIREGKDEVFEHPNDPKRGADWLRHVEEDVQAQSLKYRRELEYVAARNRRLGGHDLTIAEQHLIEEFQNRPVKPNRPRCIIVIDDCQGTWMLSQSTRSPLVHLCLKIRHLGDGVGCSLAIISQSARGVPKNIRLQVTALFAFATCNVKEIETLYEECAAFTSRADFESALRLYTGRSRHSFLFVDMYMRELRGHV